MHTPGSLPQLFINGAPAAGSLSRGSATAQRAVSPNPFTVGVSSDGSGRFQKLIDEVFVCSGALTAADIRSMTNAPDPSAWALSLPLPIITNDSPLPGGQVGANYSFQLTATGGTPGFVWPLFSGTLPAELTLNTNTGVIAGRPAAVGTNTFTIRVIDSFAQTGEKEFTLVTTNEPAVPPGGSASDCLVHWKFDEISGFIALDSTGNGNHGALLDGPVRTNGMMGGALRFDGSNDRVSATNRSALNVTGAVTIACWVRPESVSGSRYLVIKSSSSSSKYSCALRASDAKLQYRWVSPSGSENKFGTSANVLTNRQWTHLAVVHTPGSLPVIYVNGVAVSAVSTPVR